MARTVSVIVSTYNRVNLVSETILSLLNQTFPEDLYEIIVVDNNSTDNTKEVINGIINSNRSEVPMKYVLEERQGVSTAENKGAKHARNEILYFINDDVIADKNLLTELLKVFDLDSKIAVATGLILPKFEVSPPKWILKHCLNYILSINNDQKDNLILVSKNDFGVFSCHQAITREVFFKTQGFHPENVGGIWVGDGETGLNRDIKKLGYYFAFTAKSILYHLIPKGRLTQSYINKRLANQGNSDSYSYYREFKPSTKQLYFQILRHCIMAVYSLCLATLFLAIGYSQWHIRWALVFYWIARVKYDFKLINDNQWRKFVMKSDWLSKT